MPRGWSRADRVSDRIVDVLSEELYEMKADKSIDGLQLLAGWLLAFKGLQATMPPNDHPASLKLLEHAVDTCLHEIMKL